MQDYLQLEATLLAFALAYPEAYEDFPWDERVVKVRKKTFAFLGIHQGKLYLGAKLLHSGAEALSMPFTEPMGYGLGRSGWVTASFSPGDIIPLELLQEWIDESYRAVAPKNLVATLPSPEANE